MRHAVFLLDKRLKCHKTVSAPNLKEALGSCTPGKEVPHAPAQTVRAAYVCTSWSRDIYTFLQLLAKLRARQHVRPSASREWD
jgi:hypothetical protein